MLKLIISIALVAAAIVLTVVSVARKSIGERIHATAAGAAMCLIAAIGLHAFAIVPAGHTGVRVHLGNVSETVLASGLHWKTPVLDKIVNVNNKIQRADVQGETSTKDLQAIGANVSVNYNVSPGAAATLYRDVGGKVVDTIIKPAIQEAIKSTFAMFTAEELITRRSEVSQLIQESLSDKLDSYGVKVHEMNILDTVSVFASNDMITGNAVYLIEPFTKQKGLFWIDEDSHTWKNGLHTASLTLNFKNIMREGEAGTEET